jgi:MFS family permease
VKIEQKYILYKCFKDLVFVGAIWLLFYRFFMTDRQVGVLDAISFALGLLVEIPSGALADRIGHKKIAFVGSIAAGFAFIMQGLSNAYWMILVSQVIMTAGWSLRSGADTSLIYENYKLEHEGSSKGWKALLVRGGKYAIIAELLGYFSGGYLYAWNHRAPFILFGICIMISGTILLTLKELPKVHSGLTYVKDLWAGVKQLLLPECRRYLPVLFIVNGLFYIFSTGLLRPILQSQFGFGAISSSWLLLGCGIFTLLLQAVLQKTYSSDSEVRIFTLTMAVLIVALLAGSLSRNMAIGAVLIAVLYSFEYLFTPWIDAGVNEQVSSQYRATALSAVSFVRSVPYVVLAPLIGYISEVGKVSIFTFIYALAVALALLSYLALSSGSRKKVRA